MSFGDHRGFNERSLDEPASEALFRQALDLGITVWDTANVYQLGSSEEYVGRAITKLTRRENLVVATKLRFTMHDGPGGEGLSGKAIMEQIENQYSLMMREDEKEMYGLLADEGVGSIPYSPVAKGRLTRPWGKRTALRQRPGRPPLRQRVRPARGGRGAASGGGPRTADGSDRPGLGPPQPRRRGPDRGTDQAPPPE